MIRLTYTVLDGWHANGLRRLRPGTRVCHVWSDAEPPPGRRLADELIAWALRAELRLCDAHLGAVAHFDAYGRTLRLFCQAGPGQTLASLTQFRAEERRRTRAPEGAREESHAGAISQGRDAVESHRPAETGARGSR